MVRFEGPIGAGYCRGYSVYIWMISCLLSFSRSPLSAFLLFMLEPCEAFRKRTLASTVCLRQDPRVGPLGAIHPYHNVHNPQSWKAVDRVAFVYLVHGSPSGAIVGLRLYLAGMGHQQINHRGLVRGELVEHTQIREVWQTFR
ncbi:hypothetical protein F4808DRAFT_72298 [Astrocystis sublimbata]|nr:hypothetical protein F4808DRAFT_72298 [Astrocystis sublimbata]